jgi:hypothetical protein
MTDGTVAPTAAGLPHTTQELLRTLSRDMKFLGYVYIIGGGLYCLTIIGAIVGVPVLISGLRLKDAGESFASYGMQPNAAMLRTALEQQAKFFFIQKVLIIIALVLMVLGFVLMFAFIGLLVDRGMSSMS